MRILVTGGAGYIGSITVKKLINEGYDVVVFDNLSYGHKENVTCELVVGDLTNKQDFGKLSSYKFDAVVHFAAYALAGESMEKPYKYLSDNVQGTLNLLEFMVQQKIKNIIFSSSCAIYGNPDLVPVNETEALKPQSTYGESKKMCEEIINWYNKIYKLNYVNLRYFNASGASLDGNLGEAHTVETHIIPLAMRKALKNEEFTIFGNQYPTPDGTCIRDYIHVEDLARAHLEALRYLSKNGKSCSLNIGTGKGYSNLEVINMIRKATGINFPVIFGEPRIGDPAVVYADSGKANKILGFKAQYSDLETIINSALAWHKRKGF